MNLELGQIITQIIGFLIMLWILKKFAWKPLLDVMENRKNEIKNRFQSIEDEKTRLKKLEEDYQKKIANIDVEAREKFQDSMKEGNVAAQGIKEEAYAEAKRIIQKAEEQKNREVENAKGELKDQLVKMVMAASEKIIGQSLDNKQQEKLLAEFVEQTKNDLS